MTLISEQNSHSSLFKTESIDEKKEKTLLDHRIIIKIIDKKKEKERKC